MLADLHDSIQRLLHEKGRILPQDVDVRFETPTREWMGSLVRPTVDFFLYEVRENTDLRGANPQANRSAGSTSYRVPPRRFDCMFLVSAITTLVEDEHRLLWRTLATLLKHVEMPPEVLTPALRDANPALATKVAGPDTAASLMEIWSRLDVPPRAALHYVVTLPLDPDIVFEAPLVLTRVTRYGRAENGVHTNVHTQIGGVVRDRRGVPIERATLTVANRARREVITSGDGRFVLPNVDAGPLVLEVRGEGRDLKRVTLDVPSDSYDIELD